MMSIRTIVKMVTPPILILLWRKVVSRKQVKEHAPIMEKITAYNFIIDLNRRSNLPLQSLDALSEDYSFEDIKSISSDNDEPNYYGSFWVLQRYAGFSLMNLPPRDFSVQHGIIYEMMEWMYNKRDLRNFVWSDKVADMFREQMGAVRVYAVGAPFLYAESILSETEIANERKRLGRNLLAFPMHSTHYIKKEYDPSPFLKTLESQKSRFDTVRVCLYWKDIQNGMTSIYRNAGFECVCCGHMFDQYFLSRQKSLLEIADATISNAVGSHIGYSISMGKPHCLKLDEFELHDLEGNEGAEEMALIKRSKNYNDIVEAFKDNESYVIFESQRRIVDEYWGTSCKMPKEKLNELLRDLYRPGGGVKP